MDFEDQSGLHGGLGIDQFILLASAMATIRNTRGQGNRVTAVNTNPNSDAVRLRRGRGRLRPRCWTHVTVTDNSVGVMTGAGFAGGDGGGMEIDAPVTMRDSVVAQQHRRGAGSPGRDRIRRRIAMFGADLTLERTLVDRRTRPSATEPPHRCRSAASRACSAAASRTAPRDSGIDADPHEQRRQREPPERKPGVRCCKAVGSSAPTGSSAATTSSPATSRTTASAAERTETASPVEGRGSPLVTPPFAGTLGCDARAGSAQSVACAAHARRAEHLVERDPRRRGREAPASRTSRWSSGSRSRCRSTAAASASLPATT